MGKLTGRIEFILAACSCLLLAPACSPRAPSPLKQTIALSRAESLLKEITSSSGAAPELDAQAAIAKLATADVVAIGESHEIGLERQILAEVYRGLFARTGAPRKCLVETYENLIGSNGKPGEDALRPVFNGTCKPELIFDNQTWDYTTELARALNSQTPGIVLVHTGYRHSMPLGKFYPSDFEPNESVDLSAHGSVTLQVSVDFDRAGKKVRSFAPLALDNLLVHWLGRELSQGSEPARLARELETLLAAPALRFESPEKFKVFELKRVARAISHHEAFVGVFDPGVLKPEILKALLGSPELAAFQREFRSQKIRFGYFRGGDGRASFSLGDHQLSTSGVFFFATRDPSDARGEIYLYVDSDLKVIRFAYSASRPRG